VKSVALEVVALRHCRNANKNLKKKKNDANDANLALMPQTSQIQFNECLKRLKFDKKKYLSYNN
jgi:hypothetical protein